MVETNELECDYCGAQLIFTKKHKNTHIPKHFRYYKCVECGRYWAEERKEMRG